MVETYVLPSAPTDGAPVSLKPEIRVLESSETYGKLVIEPLQRGYAITIGNSLRRILLNSIKGSAITWVKLEDVLHEYTTIPGVNEEVMELLLNIKRIRVRSRSDRTGKMRLEVSGEGRVCAGDIATSADFEIVNPELHLATLDSDEARLSIEFNIERGVGYQPAVQSEGINGLPVGTLPVDAVFNPIRKVNYAVERTRVGQVTDYERLVLEVWTDGTITSLDAVREASESLVNHFFLFSTLNREGVASAELPSRALSPEVYQTPIERLELSPRTLNCLKRAHITRIGEVLEMSDDDLLKIRNFGEKSLAELRRKLAERDVSPSRMEAGGAKEQQPATVAPPTDKAIDLSAADIGELMGAVAVGEALESRDNGGEPSHDEEEAS